MADPGPEPVSGLHYAAVGEDGLRMFSPDGRGWTHEKLGREGEVFSSLAFGAGKLLVTGRFGGENSMAVTSDGAAWQASKHDAQYAKYIRSVHFVGRRFLAYGTTFVLPSDDGVTWGKEIPIAEYKVQYGIDCTLRRFAFGEGTIVAVGDFGRCAVSHDGIEWKNAPAIKAVNTMIDVAYGNGVFVGGGMHGLRMRSVDGLEWTDRVVGEEGEHINAMIFTGAQFVGIGQGATYTSPDGVTWSREPNTNAPTTATFAQGVFVGARWPGRLLRSADGLAWEDVARAPRHVLAVAHGRLGPGVD